MAIEEMNEKRFEQDIESSLLEHGYLKGADVYNPDFAVFQNTLIDFIKDTQPKAWNRFVIANNINPERKFLIAFNNAVDQFGLLHVIRKGFKHRGIPFRIIYFKPETNMNEEDIMHYHANRIEVYRQWFYSKANHKSVDMLISINGIPLFALELKNQYTGQNIDNSISQWMNDRDPRELCFQFNTRILAFFGVDHNEVKVSTKLNGLDTYFLPFNQGSNGPGKEGGAGNPANPNGYPTSYLWEEILERDSILDILSKYLNIDETVEDGERKVKLIFPRYHQIDAVRKLIKDVGNNGVGKNYLINHSAGSGKSNTIAWTAYKLASLHVNNKDVFSSVIVVTDRKALDRQLQATISSIDHQIGSVVTIDKDKNSKDLRDAINDGSRLIVTTLQKFPIIYKEINKSDGNNYAIIIDEAHSSQTGTAAKKLRVALADTTEALKEFADLEEIEEDKVDTEDKIIQELISQGKHKNLSFFAFTATPKPQTLEMFGDEMIDGGFHAFHIYSMKQAIEEGFILNVLDNYMTYKTCFRIAKTSVDNPEMPSSRTSKAIKNYENLHPYNINKKADIILETFMGTTKNKIDGKGKMIVVASSRLAAVLYYKEIKKLIEEKGYQNDVDALVAFSGTINYDGIDYTESNINTRKDGSTISESQTVDEFHNNFDILVVAEKYQTGFDEPLLHTMVVDKKLRGIKAVQTLSRLNRTHKDKNDTFVLDFINSNEDILEAFQPFYQEISLENEVNTDKLYVLQNEIHQMNIYSPEDVEKFCAEYYKKGKQDNNALGRVTSILKPVCDVYNSKEQNTKYLFRRKIRSLVRWYNYISQVIRMFDIELHKEYIFCSYLIKLLPKDEKENIDLSGKIKLEFYKLSKTFEGEIKLNETNSTYVDGKDRESDGKDAKKPLEEIIKKINDRYKGEFTDGDKVLVETLENKLMSNSKLINNARTSDYKIFVESIFPAIFDKVLMESYIESKESYKSIYENMSKYNTIKSVMADIVFEKSRDIKTIKY